MHDPSLIVTPFAKAVASVEDVLAQPKTIYVRDAAIQRFEYTFELAIRMIQRYFQKKGPNDVNIDTLTYNDLCRMAAEAELIINPEEWFEFRKARNITSHIYDEEKANLVYTITKRFLPEAKYLLLKLRERV